MSNFLSHLVMRSLNPMETSVQPRLPSLFEPVAGIPALGTVPEGLGEPEVRSAIKAPQFHEVPSPQVPTHTGDIQSADRRSPPPLFLDRYPLQPRPTSDVHDLVGFIPTRQESLEPGPAAPQFPISRSQLERSPSVGQIFNSPSQEPFKLENQVSQSAKNIDSAEQKPKIVRQTVIQKVVEQLFSTQPADIDSVGVLATTKVKQGERPAAIAPNLPIETAHQMSVPITVGHSPTAIAQPPITPSIQSIRVNASTPAELPQPAPTIQVTIGRIEVRATAPTHLPLTQSRPKSPVMSLEEYLHQRGGGR